MCFSLLRCLAPKSVISWFRFCFMINVFKVLMKLKVDLEENHSLKYHMISDFFVLLIDFQIKLPVKGVVALRKKIVKVWIVWVLRSVGVAECGGCIVWALWSVGIAECGVMECGGCRV